LPGVLTAEPDPQRSLAVIARANASYRLDLTTTFQQGATTARIPVRGGGNQGFDVTADGQQFLLPLAPGGQERLGRLLVVQNLR
jgi:hypothetical protein